MHARFDKVAVLAPSRPWFSVVVEIVGSEDRLIGFASSGWRSQAVQGRFALLSDAAELELCVSSIA